MAVLLGALLLDAMFGEPRWLWGRVAHPVVVLGWVITAMDRALNHGAWRRAKGVGVVCVLVVLSLCVGGGIAALGWLFEGLAVAILLSHKSLVEHVRAVADGLRRSDDVGRAKVAMIVGRETSQLNRAGISRAAIESAGENFSDGVIAPVFWYLVFGLPGMLIYKSINTADSMIGYKNERYAEFGWAVARLDDLLNWVPARISAGMLAVFCDKPRPSWPKIRRDAGLHRSPNAGWPEAAMAYQLDVALSGPRTYGGQTSEDPFINPEGRRDIGPLDIDAAVDALWRAWRGMVVVFAVAWLLGCLF